MEEVVLMWLWTTARVVAAARVGISMPSVMAAVSVA